MTAPPAIVLVIDDSAANRQTLFELLEPEGYRVIEAVDGPTALHLAVDAPPDLILLDVMMPGMSGYEVCRRVRADARLAEVPVIMITALDDQPARLAGLEAGADDFIAKPFNRSELRARVRTITRLNRYRRLHEAQAALRDSERHFQTLFELGGVAVYTCDAAGVIQEFNRYAVKLWGREPRPGENAEQFSGAFREFRSDGASPPLDRSIIMDICSGRIAGVENQEYWIERPDGSRVTVLASIIALRNELGEISCAINSFHDITARKGAEVALRANEQWLRAVFEQAAVGVAQTDAVTGRFLRVNQRFCDIVGYTIDQIQELSFRDITHAQDMPLNLANVARLQDGVLREFTQEKRYVRKDGSFVWTSVAVSSIGSSGAAPVSFIAFVQDITGRRRFDEHFLQAQKMEALGQFSGGVAHDFNNILAAISGYTELSRMKLKENPEVNDYLGSVLRATGRATDLVRQILTFSRQQPEQRRAIQLQPVIAESLKLMRATIPTTIQFETEIAAGVPSVLANANQIHQILMNLGINAWHAMKDRTGRLRVKLEKIAVSAEHAVNIPQLRPGNYVRISVSDTGCGMDPSTLRRIFEPFFTTKAVGDGTGLGLSVVHGIMDNHDGAIAVESHLGQGTVFHLYFPVHGDEPAADVHDRVGPTPRGNGERVLVVDDEELIAVLIQETLNQLGYAAEFTIDPAAALLRVRQDPLRFSLVISDQTMPGLTGLDLALRLREIRRDLPVILMTGYSLSLSPERIEEAGIRQLLPKPLGIQLLGAAVHAVLSGQPPIDCGSRSPYR